MPYRPETPLGSPAATAAIIALLALVAVTLSGVVVSRPQAPAAAPAPDFLRVLTEPPPPAPTGAVLIDAIPWGRIERIESSAGEPYDLPDQRETPVLLELPAGGWRVALSHPELADERVCELELGAGARDDCLVEFRRVDVDRYFREAGWWR